MTEQDPDASEGDIPERCYCQLQGTVSLLSRQYAMQVICLVGAQEPIRYGEIESTFGDVSSSTLSARLEELGEADLLARKQYDEIPPRVEYKLTAKGRELCDRLVPLLEWTAKTEIDR